MSRGIEREGEQYLEYECEKELKLLKAEVSGAGCARVAERLLAAGCAGVKLGALADDDAAGLALVRAVAL